MATDPQKLKLIKDWGRPEICFSVARVPNTSRLFYGASDAKVYHVDLAAEKPEFQTLEGHTSYVMGVALAPVGSFGGNLYGLCDVAGNASELCVDPGGGYFARGGSWVDHSEQTLNLYTGREMAHDDVGFDHTVGFRLILAPQK